MSFYDEIIKEDLLKYVELIDSSTDYDVNRALQKSKNGDALDLYDFMALLSPKATSYISEMAVLAKKYTRNRFGNGVSMYVPLYLSNLCTNNCKYCGFAAHNKFPRKVLNAEETRAECEAIKKLGYEEN